MNAFLEKIEIKKILFSNDLDSGESIDLNIEIQNNVDIEESKKSCLGVAKLKVYPKKEHTKMLIEIEVAGVFSTDKAFENAEEAGNMVGQRLFPYLQAYIATITAMSGTPAMMIPEPPLWLKQD